MTSHLLEAIAHHLGRCDDNKEYNNEDRKYLRQLFVQHAFFLNAIESTPDLNEKVEEALRNFSEQQKEALS